MARITLQEYAMKRDVSFPEEWALARPNAVELLARVNMLLALLFPERQFHVASGFRPAAINKGIPHAAKKSLHMTGKAVDIEDADGFLKKYFTPLTSTHHAGLLKEHDLWVEDYDSTPTWVHFDMGTRLDRPSRVFKP